MWDPNHTMALPNYSPKPSSKNYIYQHIFGNYDHA